MNDIDTMQAGREMDALIAEQVMGLRVAKQDYGIDAVDYINQTLLDEIQAQNAQRRARGELLVGYTTPYVPTYSTDIAAAWQVVEHLTAHGIWLYELSNQRGAWSCILETRTERGVTHYQVHLEDTAPLAICRAALQAVQP